jgi:hypothetical protein
MTKRRGLLAVVLAVWGALILSCGFQDYDFDMCGGYCVVRSSAHNIIVAPKLGKSSWASSHPTAIPAKVVEVAWDDRFVVAKRQHLSRPPSARTHRPVSGSYDFWVIDTRERVRHGPLTAAEFGAKRTQLGVSPDLSLRAVTSYPTRQEQ